MFRERILVEIADALRLKSGSPALSIQSSEDIMKARLSLEAGLGKQMDIPEKSVLWLKESTKSPDRARLLYKAFCTAFPITVDPAVSARLLVNPPEGLRTKGGADGYQLTYYTLQGGLGGTYGTETAVIRLSPLVITQIKGTLMGFFDNVCLFWDAGVHVPEAVFDRVAPGTTVTFYQPTPASNCYWMGWAGLRVQYGPILAYLETHFKLTPLVNTSDPTWTVLTVGLSAK